jgi:hypothetical protein
MEIAREKKIENIDKQECECCKGIFLELVVHHINRNHNDNRDKNLIVLCKRCHAIVHWGPLKKWFSLDKERNTKLLRLREQVILNDKHLTKKKKLKRLNYESWLLNNAWTYPKSYCGLCKRTTNLVFYIPKHVKQLCPKDSVEKYSVVFCKRCLKILLKEMKAYL